MWPKSMIGLGSLLMTGNPMLVSFISNVQTTSFSFIKMHQVPARVYRPTESREKACNSRIEDEILAVTQNLTRYDVDHAL